MRDRYQINWDDGQQKEFHPVLEVFKALFLIAAAVLLTLAMRGI
jgi:hypothetical protein